MPHHFHTLSLPSFSATMEPIKVIQLSKNKAEYCNSDQEEPEEDPEEDPDEDPEEDSKYELEDEPKKVLSEEPNGIVNGDTSEEDPDEDPSEEDPDTSEEDPDNSSSETDPNKNPSGEEPNEDPSESYSDEDELEDCVSQPSSRIGTNLTDHNVREFSHQSNTKCKHEDALKPGVSHASAIEAIHGFSGVYKSVGDTEGAYKKDNLENSGKQKRSRWEQQPQQFPDESQNGNSKRRKTRWDSNDSMLKTPDQLQPNRGTVGFELDSEAQRLKLRLIEINGKLISSELLDDRPEDERSPSPEPVFNNLGTRVNTREARSRGKLIQERKRIITKLMKKIPRYQAPAVNKPRKLVKKLYIPVKEYPTYKFAGLIIGPRGNTQKKMEKETGARILLRGKGSSVKAEQKADPSDYEDDDDDLHVRIEADKQSSLDAAVAMVEKLLIPQDDQMNSHKLAQLQELAKLNGNFRDGNLCSVCREEGHKSFACPHRPSTLKTIISCDTCGSSSHPTSSCPLTAPSQVIGKPPSSSNTKIKKKEIDAANLYVGYLPKTVCESRLREMFSPFGKITSSYVVKDQETGLSKGYGFVKFENVTDAASAVMHLHGYQVDEHKLAVRVAGTPPAGTPVAGTGFPTLNPIPVYHGALNPIPVYSGALNPIPVYPGALATVYPGALNQTAWPAQHVTMLPAAQVHFPSSLGLGLPHPITASSHGYQQTSNGPTDFNNFAGMSTFSESRGAPQSYTVPSIGSTMFGSSIISTVNEAKRSSQSPNPLAHFPGDPDYQGSGFQSYFTAREY